MRVPARQDGRAAQGGTRLRRDDDVAAPARAGDAAARRGGLEQGRNWHCVVVCFGELVCVFVVCPKGKGLEEGAPLPSSLSRIAADGDGDDAADAVFFLLKVQSRHPYGSLAPSSLYYLPKMAR